MADDAPTASHDDDVIHGDSGVDLPVRWRGDDTLDGCEGNDGAVTTRRA